MVDFCPSRVSPRTGVAAESDETVGIARCELLRDTFGDVRRRMHHGVRRKRDAERTENLHEMRSGPCGMMRIGKNENSLATQGSELVTHLCDGAESE